MTLFSFVEDLGFRSDYMAYLRQHIRLVRDSD